MVRFVMPAQPSPSVEPLGDAAWLVRWAETLDPQANRQALALASRLADHRPAVVTDVVPAYASLAVFFSPGTASAQETLNWLLENLSTALSSLGAKEAPAGRLVEIPTRYGGEDGPDLEEVASACSLTPRQVISRHSRARYRVACLGFSPGFPYLLGLPPSLQMPRRAVPRLSVPVGSVAIGGAQTGIYPAASPGGWHLIGRTLLPLFSPEQSPPTLLQPGDEVRFVPCS